MVNDFVFNINMHLASSIMSVRMFHNSSLCSDGNIFICVLSVELVREPRWSWCELICISQKGLKGEGRVSKGN